MDTFKPGSYLARINHPGDIELTEEGLRSLHRSQLFSIPFENFDVLLKRPVLLDPGSLASKLVDRPRGGYCFELNGLFLHALNHFGFTARALLARVHLHGVHGARGHQLSLVTIGSRQWLADVGFGGFNMREPIPFEINREAACDGQRLRIVRRQPYGTMLQALSEDGWLDLYSFDLEHVGPADIKQGNYYSSTHPDSIFVVNRAAALSNESGRVTLLNYTLRIVEADGFRVCDLPDDQRYLDALKSHFGIDLDAAYDQLPPLVSAEDDGK